MKLVRNEKVAKFRFDSRIRISISGMELVRNVQYRKTIIDQAHNVRLRL